MNNDLISRSALLKRMKQIIFDTSLVYQIDAKSACETIEALVDVAPAVDAVPLDEYDALLKRFRHLLKSDYIRSFDEHDPRTHTYKRDISEAVEPTPCAQWVSAMDRLPENGGDYLVVIEDHDFHDKNKVHRSVDVATSFGSYIDDF